MDTVSDRKSRESRDKMLMLKIVEAIKSIKYGYIQITMHDGEVGR